MLPGQARCHGLGVLDGDSIEVVGRAVRLNGLNCEERGTTGGDWATVAMRRLVGGHTVSSALNGDRS